MFPHHLIQVVHFGLEYYTNDIMYFSRSCTLEVHDSCLSLRGDTNFYHLVITCAFSTVWILFLVPISPFAINKQFVEDTLRLCKCPIPYQTYCPPPIGRTVYKRIHWWILLESIFTIQLQNGDFPTVIFLSMCIIIRASPLFTVIKIDYTAYLIQWVIIHYCLFLSWCWKIILALASRNPFKLVLVPFWHAP